MPGNRKKGVCSNSLQCSVYNVSRNTKFIINQCFNEKYHFEKFEANCAVVKYFYR